MSQLRNCKFLISILFLFFFTYVLLSFKSSSKEENFLDLSVDVEQNTSISHCLQEFSNMEMLCGECKYYCENCSSKQEAEKRFFTQ